MPFQDSVVTNEIFVRLNMVGVVRKNVSVSYSSAICIRSTAAESSSPTGVRVPSPTSRAELAIASFVSGNDVFLSLHRVWQVS